MTDYVARARAIADDVLFPFAAEVDAKGEVPSSHFELLAAEGFYGLAAPADAGGAGLELPAVVEVLETLAGGCLSTMFTWIQHHGVVMILLNSPNEALRARYFDALVRGELRGGVAFAGAIPTPPRLRARRVDGGYVFDGEAPFVSGWGVIDVLQISGREGDNVVSAIVDPVADEHLNVERLDLVAAQGTSTVRLGFDRFFVPQERVSAEVPYADFAAANVFGSRLNGCAPLGVAGRAIRLIEQAGKDEVAAALRTEQQLIRGRLDAGLADPPTLPAARAAGAELAYRCAGALVAAAGSSAVLKGQHAERLVRETTFLLVAASRPEIKNGLLGLFSKA